MTLDLTLGHRFGGFHLDVAFSAPEGVTALFGRSGSGKTTVVNAVAGLLQPDQGRIALNGDVLVDTGAGIAIPAHRRRIGYVFQEGRLFPHLSVGQNLAFGRWFAPREPVAGGEDHVIEMLGIGHLLTRRPAQLSGGEKQRVAIGRALLAAPQLLLMDEPLAALDEARKAEILPYLERLRDEVRVPIVYVSHTVSEVARLATTVVAMHDGGVLRAGPAAEVLSDPEAVPSLGVREAGAVLPARVISHDPGDGLTALAVSGGQLVLPRVNALVGSRVRVRIEAHDIILARTPPREISALNLLPATVTHLREGEGPGVAVGLQCGSDRLLARITRRSARALGLTPGMTCYAVLKAMSVARRDVGRDTG